jgi:hypothetical protein
MQGFFCGRNTCNVSLRDLFLENPFLGLKIGVYMLDVEAINLWAVRPTWIKCKSYNIALPPLNFVKVPVQNDI